MNSKAVQKKMDIRVKRRYELKKKVSLKYIASYKVIYVVATTTTINATTAAAYKNGDICISTLYMAVLPIDRHPQMTKPRR